MPTYEYVCSACSHSFEEFQSITAAPLKKCPACNRRALRRLIGTGAAFIFKGSGFYQTDYRSDSYRKAEKAEKESAAPAPKTEASAGSGDKKGPSKTAAKADSGS